MLQKDFDPEGEEEARFINEVNTLISMDNPTILKIIGYSKCNFSGDPYITIILDYMPNGSLYEVLKQIRDNKTPIGWTKTKVYINLLGIAIGMKYLHSKNTVQRDLKPGNILLDENYHPQICDFGFSKKLDELNSEKLMVSKLGTMHYVAPEILSSSYTYKVDVYAYSILAYELITTKLPYSKNFNVYQVHMGKRPDTSIISDQIVVNFLKKCWSNNPNERLTFSQIVEILEDKRFYSKFDVDLEIKNYLKLFENEKLSEDVPASDKPTALDAIISMQPDANTQSTPESKTTHDVNASEQQDKEASKVQDASTAEPKDKTTSEPQDASTAEPLCSSAILDIETDLLIGNRVDQVFRQPIITGKILEDMKAYSPKELLITPETIKNPIQKKPYEDFIPTISIYLDRYLSKIDYGKLQNLLSEDAVILNVKSFLDNLPPAYQSIEDFDSGGEIYKSKLQIALLSIEDFEASNVESKLNKS